MITSNLVYGLIYHSGLLGSFTSVVPAGDGLALETEDGDEILLENGDELFDEG